MYRSEKHYNSFNVPDNTENQGRIQFFHFQINIMNIFFAENFGYKCWSLAWGNMIFEGIKECSQYCTLFKDRAVCTQDKHFVLSSRTTIDVLKSVGHKFNI